MNPSATVRLELDTRPESVTLVRAMLSAIAEPLRLDDELLDDIKTAVSEACNNVIVHAYGEDGGPFSVQVDAARDGLTTTVRDHGCGMDESARDDATGVGLAVISALTQCARFLAPCDGGTEVRMWFSGGGARSSPPPSACEGARGDAHARLETAPRAVGQPPLQLTGDVVATVSPVSLMTAVLGRLARALAASAHFSFDRFADVYLVADTLGAHAQEAVSGDRVSFALRSGGRRLEVDAGPFAVGSCAQLARSVAPPTHDSPLGLLADEIAVDRAGALETLHVLLRDGDAYMRSEPV